MSVEQYMGYYRLFQVYNLVTSLQLTRSTQLSLLYSVFFSAINLALSVSEIGSHNLSSDVNISLKCWQHFSGQLCDVLWYV